MHLSTEDHLLLIQESADFKLLSLKEQRVLLDGDIRNLLANIKPTEAESKRKTPFDPILQAYIARNLEGEYVPYLLLRDNSVYFHSPQFNEWMHS